MEKKYKRIACYCEICNTFIGEYMPSQTRRTCSKKCYKTLQSILCTGSTNPNYKDGNTYLSKYCSCGKEIDHRAKTCKKCAPHVGRKHTDKTKRLIGLKSRLRNTKEYRRNFRSKMEANGTWIPLNCLDEYKLYFRFASWKKGMFNDISNKEKELLKERGIFNNKTNTRGVVRDHMYSRKSGFLMGVFPEILRHPENCNIITHSDNVKKKSGNNRDKDAQTLRDLFLKIEGYSGKWEEQALCLKLIIRYKKGDRYNRDLYIKKYGGFV